MTPLLCILCLAGGIVIGLMVGLRMSALAVANSIRSGRMRLLVEEYEQP